MRQTFILLFALTLLSGCASVKIIPLKNTYQTKPYEAVSDNNKDVVWDKIVDFFAQNGLSIKLIDRSSGLIVSEATALTFTHEDSKGQLIHPDSWVVLVSVYDAANKKYIQPNVVIGEWNIRIKEIPGNKTNVNVNLVNIRYSSPNTDPLLPAQLKYVSKFEAQSTGKFEDKIFNIVK